MRVLGRVERYRDRLQLDVRSIEPAPDDRPGRLRAGDAPRPRRARRLPRVPRRRDLPRRPARARQPHPRRRRRSAAGSARCPPHPTATTTTQAACSSTRSASRRSAASSASCIPVSAPTCSLAAALLHDVGRTVELEPGPGFRQTSEGRLLGHVHLGRAADRGARRRTRRSRPRGAPARRRLHHDARAAKTAEAAVLYHANQLDAVAATRPVEAPSTGLAAILLALAASASWGVSDFLGGLTSRRLSLPTVMAITTPLGLVVIGAIVAVRGEPLPSTLVRPLGGARRRARGDRDHVALPGARDRSDGRRRADLGDRAADPDHRRPRPRRAAEQRAGRRDRAGARRHGADEPRARLRLGAQPHCDRRCLRPARRRRLRVLAGRTRRGARTQTPTGRR